MAWSWLPTPDYVEHANVTRLIRRLGLASYGALVEWSLDDPRAYWEAVVTDLRIGFDEPYDEVLDASAGPAWPKWFVGGRLNLAAHCVDRTSEERPSAVAVHWENEAGDRRAVSYSEMRASVDAVARELGRRGVGLGDTAAIVMPMCPEAVFALYAVAKLGAVSVPIFSGFSSQAIASRLVDAGACVVVACEHTARRGRRVELGELVRAAAASCPGTVQTLFLRDSHGEPPEDVFGKSAPPIVAASVPSEHPLMLNYTSGTTGAPKGAVHVHAGFLVKVASEAAYLTDLRPGDAILWVTDLGWLMGPWTIVGAHAAGACALLYEGAPDHPGPERLWNLCRSHRVTVLGLSPTLVRALRAQAPEPLGHSIPPTLRILASTGEPWDPSSYEWLGEVVGGGSRPIVNISGGTEVGACFLGQPPVIPTKTCSVGLPLPGMDLDVYDPAGQPLRKGVGELVCRSPWPAQTRGFWRQPERYLETYWSRWDGVWAHGDFASVDDDGYWFLHGRSDDTLTIAGKRVGPAEVEAAVLRLPEIRECAAVGIPEAVKGEAIWCFCVPAPGAERERLEVLVRRAVATELGRAFGAVTVIVATDLPKTRSGKLMRRLIRGRVLGEPPGDVSTLESPAALTAIDQALADRS